MHFTKRSLSIVFELQECREPWCVLGRGYPRVYAVFSNLSNDILPTNRKRLLTEIAARQRENKTTTTKNTCNDLQSRRSRKLQGRVRDPRSGLGTSPARANWDHWRELLGTYNCTTVNFRSNRDYKNKRTRSKLIKSILGPSSSNASSLAIVLSFASKHCRHTNLVPPSNTS
ncbi:hypothetical protein CBL_11306 [Carabus blaptoides fortunei]